MVAAMLRDEPNSRWADVLDNLKNADLEEIQIQFPDYAFPSLVAAIEVSVSYRQRSRGAIWTWLSSLRTR